MIYIQFIYTTVLFVLIARPLTVLLNELGHAFTALLLTRKKVVVYIGSYGDSGKSLKFKLGIIELWFRYNFFSWDTGLCVPSVKNNSINKQIIYTLAGPLTSFVCAVTACYFAFLFDLHGSLKLFLVIFFSSACIDLYTNLRVNPVPIKLHNGDLVYNDGYTLKQLFYFKKVPKEYISAIKLYEQEKYQEAAASFEKMLNNRLKHENLYPLMITSYLQIKNYIRAKDLIDEFLKEEKMNSNDFVHAGITYSRLGFHTPALEFYAKALELNPENIYALCNQGYTLNLTGNYIEAIPLFERALELDPDFAYSYNNRGLAKIKTGKASEGFEDIKKSLEIDPENALAYRNLGIYYLEEHEFDKALSLFLKAKEMEQDLDEIDELILETESHIS